MTCMEDLRRDERNDTDENGPYPGESLWRVNLRRAYRMFCLALLSQFFGRL